MTDQPSTDPAEGLDHPDHRDAEPGPVVRFEDPFAATGPWDD